MKPDWANPIQRSQYQAQRLHQNAAALEKLTDQINQTAVAAEQKLWRDVAKLKQKAVDIDDVKAE